MPGVWPLRIRKKNELRKKKESATTIPRCSEFAEKKSKFRILAAEKLKTTAIKTGRKISMIPASIRENRTSCESPFSLAPLSSLEEGENSAGSGASGTSSVNACCLGR
jgi:hypothetical protein